MLPLRTTLAVLLLLLPRAVSAEEAPLLSVELNKLEPVAASPAGPGGCLMYLVVSEATARVDALRLELVLFGGDGAVSRNIAVDLGPVAPGRTQVRGFELSDLPCDGIREVLANQAMICTVGGAADPRCLDRIKLGSRTAAKFVK